jgi:hypothetical protein
LTRVLIRRLRQAFDSDFEIVTVTEQGWSGMKNSELLRAAEAEFDALVTMDRGTRLPGQWPTRTYASAAALAITRGDIQAAKEMKVFLKRLQK